MRSYSVWTPAEEAKLRLALSKPTTWAAVRAVMAGRTLASVQKKADSMGLSITIPVGGTLVEVSEDGHTTTVSSPVSERIVTAEQLLEMCRVDLSVWEIERQVVNKWEVGTKHPETGDVLVTPLIQVKVTLRRTASPTLLELRKLLVEDIRAEVHKGRPQVVRYKPNADGYLFEFPPVDLHMGKYTWDEETVANYDVDIAEDLFNQALDYLLNRAMRVTDGKIDRVLCLFGNDVSHIDDKSGQTTAGTRMDVDTRFIRVYRRICAIHRRAVDILRQVAPVDIKIVPGNHDELTSFHLGEILTTRYEDTPHVTIDNGPKSRKYYDYGVNLFGFTHGDEEKVSELPLVMAREEPERWGRCPSREWHIGHKHIVENHTWHAQDLFSDKGVRVRRLASLTAHDHWHTRHAYMDRRACEAFVFHKTAGFTDQFSMNVDHFSGKGLTV